MIDETTKRKRLPVLRIALKVLASMVMAVVALYAAALVFWWLHQGRAMYAECAASQKLVDRNASREELIKAFGQTWEYGVADLQSLERYWRSNTSHMESIRRGVHGKARLLLYSNNVSIRFIFLDEGGRATHQECFAQ